MPTYPNPVKRAPNDLPYNQHAEQAVLGSALLTRDALYEVLSSLEEEDFFEFIARYSHFVKEESMSIL